MEDAEIAITRRRDSSTAADHRVARDIGCRYRRAGIDDLVAEPLVITFGMVVFQELPDGGTQHILSEEDHP